jgi:membrane associated rhomboid family serine protease
VEQIYGRAEFLRFYLVTIVAAGLVWLAVQVAQGVPAVQEIPAIDGAPAMQGVVVVENVGARLLGASGGVMGVMILFVLHFPRRMFYIWGIIPLPAWALGAICVLSDLLGARNQSGDVAHVAHLAGVAFGATYYLTGLNLGRLVPQRFGSRLFRMRPSLRIHDPQQDARNLSEKVDEILEKISQQGESSLTKQERRTLEEASRRYQRRRE